MPFADATFDAAITLHVAMNIKDRAGLYREIARVLKRGAVLCIYDVMQGPNEGLIFPVPWAETSASSHLTTPEEMRALLADAGFSVEEVEDRTEFGIAFFRERLAAGGPPSPLGLHVLMGETARAEIPEYAPGSRAGCYRARGDDRPPRSLTLPGQVRRHPRACHAIFALAPYATSRLNRTQARTSEPQRRHGMRHGGKILVNQLEAQGATAAFTVPGESFLAALDGLHDSNRIKTVICRQEGGAAMMAEAWGKITGEPGICFVTRGPGAANAMSGLHVAQQDSTPMVMFVGMPAREHEDREAFQEIEVKQLFSSFVKWAAVIRQTERIPEYVSRAFHAARSGRPGPVVLGLPEDMLSATAEAIDAKPARVASPGVSSARRRAAAGPAGESAAARDDRRRAGMERATSRRRSKPSPTASTCRSRRRSATRTTSTTGTAATSAAPASASIPSWPRPSSRPTC